MTGEALLSSRGRELVPLERDTVATFRTTRGAFVVPAEVVADDHALSVAFARGLPERAEGVTILPVWRAQRDGSVAVSWRRIVTTVRQA